MRASLWVEEDVTVAQNHALRWAGAVAVYSCLLPRFQHDDQRHVISQRVLREVYGLLGQQPEAVRAPQRRAAIWLVTTPLCVSAVIPALLACIRDTCFCVSRLTAQVGLTDAQ